MCLPRKRSTSFAAQDREQVGLDAGVRPERRQAVEELVERLLDDIVGVGRLPQPPPRESQQPALVARDQRRPRLAVAPADLLEQVLFALRKFGHLGS